MPRLYRTLLGRGAIERGGGATSSPGHSLWYSQYHRESPGDEGEDDGSSFAKCKIQRYLWHRKVYVILSARNKSVVGFSGNLTFKFQNFLDLAITRTSGQELHNTYGGHVGSLACMQAGTAAWRPKFCTNVFVVFWCFWCWNLLKNQNRRSVKKHKMGNCHTVGPNQVLVISG